MCGLTPPPSSRELLDAAPEQVRSKAEAAYRFWTDNPTHPSLRYKKVHRELPIYSVRIDIEWRAVGVLRDGEMVWFWIGRTTNTSDSLRNDRVEAEVLALAPGFVARFIRYAERMELFGPDLGMPHTRAKTPPKEIEIARRRMKEVT